jgi:putative two-component system response regulator
MLGHLQPDLILMDIEMPQMDGYETCRQLKQDPLLAQIPVIFLTAKSDENSEIEGFELGAVDYVQKPFRSALLKKRIETHITLAEQRAKLEHYNENLTDEVRRKTAQVIDLQSTMLETVTEMVEFRDNVTGGHIERTQQYLRFLVQDLMARGVYAHQVRDWDIELLIASAPLHDTGKIAISDAILNKPGKLTAEEFEIMKKHVDFGVDAIERIAARTPENSFLQYARVIAQNHHEKWDGSGYPRGLKGIDIPLEGRLMAIADVYDALISPRPYKRAFSTNDAERIIREGRGTHFDPLLVDVFYRCASRFAHVAHGFNWNTIQPCELLAS